MSRDELVFVAVAVGWFSLFIAVAQWWHRARTIWLSRLSSRGFLAGTYTPAPQSVWGVASVKWLVRQRMPLSDLARMTKLEDVPDDDDVTEIWRVRMIRRSKLTLAIGFGGLAAVAASWVTYGLLGAAVFAVLICVAIGGSVFVYRPLRAWGEYGAERLP